MDAPAALQRHAASIVAGKFRDTDKLWAALQSSDAAAARLCKQAKTVGPLNQKLIDALAIVLGTMQKSSSNRGRKNLSRAAKPTIPSSAGSVPKGAGKGNGEPQRESRLVGPGPGGRQRSSEDAPCRRHEWIQSNLGGIFPQGTRFS